MPVVEDIIQVESTGLDVECVELVRQSVWTRVVGTEYMVEICTLEVVSRATVIKVESYFRCVETEVEGEFLFFLQRVFSNQSVEINVISPEKPFPSGIAT